MKKALLVLSAIIFVGAGCASTATTTEQPVTVPTTTVQTAPAATTAPSTAKPAAGADVKTSVKIIPAEEKTTK